MRFSYRRSAADEATIEVDIVPIEDRDDCYRVTVGEQVFELSANVFQRAAFSKDRGEIVLQYEGREYHLFDATQRRHQASAPRGDLRAPTAGKIIRVLVAPGDEVKAGDALVILEAMKMEQQITAPQDGVVERVLCHEGDQVAAGVELVVLTSATGEAPQ
jgi:3-methylcrotonyl-CoA carboxylase alpha subunit